MPRARDRARCGHGNQGPRRRRPRRRPQPASSCCSSREEELEVVGEAGNGDEAILRAALLEAGRRADGRGRCRAAAGSSSRPLCSRRAETKVLMLSMQDDPSYVREAFTAGASGYVLKDAVDTEVVAAVREVAAGDRYVHPTLGARLAAAEVRARNAAPRRPLSDREREVLRLLALGHTNQEIAKLLVISSAPPRRTGRTSCEAQPHHRAELVRYAIEHGLLADARLVAEAQPRQLALGPVRGEAGVREREHALEDEVARLPARRELRVEPVEALDLEVAGSRSGAAAEQALAAVAGSRKPAEGGEVERQLLDAALAQLLDRARRSELGQPVRRLRSRRISSATRRAAVGGTKCRKPRTVPSPSRATRRPVLPCSLRASPSPS